MDVAAAEDHAVLVQGVVKGVHRVVDQEAKAVKELPREEAAVKKEVRKVAVVVLKKRKNNKNQSHRRRRSNKVVL